MPEPIDQVEVYEKLKPELGDSETKLLLRYMEEVTRGAAASKDNLYSLRDELRQEIHSTRDELKGDFNSLRDELKGDFSSLREDFAAVKSTMATKDDLWKLRLLIIIVLLVVLFFNPAVIGLIAKVFGIGK